MEEYEVNIARIEKEYAMNNADKLVQLEQRLHMFQKIVHRIKEEIRELKEQLKEK